jgi:putative ABC transport system permease protein
VVNETFVKRYFEGVDPLAQRIAVEELIPGVARLGPPVEWQIVGVFADVRNGGPQGEGFPEIDVPFRQSPWPTASLAIRTKADPDRLRTSVAAVVQSLDPDLPVTGVKTMDQVVDEGLAGNRFAAVLMGTFASMALLLAAVGIYGVMSFAVAQRTHEIGLRMALGAPRSHVLGLMLLMGGRLVLVGLGVGIAASLAATRLLRSQLFGVEATDPLAYAAVVVLLGAVTLLACYVPARRAAGVDPMVALRQE